MDSDAEEEVEKVEKVDPKPKRSRGRLTDSQRKKKDEEKVLNKKKKDEERERKRLEKETQKRLEKEARQKQRDEAKARKAEQVAAEKAAKAEAKAAEKAAKAEEKKRDQEEKKKTKMMKKAEKEALAQASVFSLGTAADQEAKRALQTSRKRPQQRQTAAEAKQARIQQVRCKFAFNISNAIFINDKYILYENLYCHFFHFRA